MPRNRSKSGRYIDWAGIITKLRKTPGLWSLELTDTSPRTAASVRLRRHRDLRVEDGRLEADIINVHEDELGVQRGDLYLRFVPYTTSRGQRTPPGREVNHGKPQRNPPDQGDES